MQWLLAIPTAVGLYILSHLWSLVLNYFAVHKSGLPVYISPTDPANIIHLVFSVPLRPILQKLIPTIIFDRMKPNIYGWEFADKNALHEKLGACFVLVTPSSNDLWVADPAIASEILARRNDFVQHDAANKIVGMFGPNLITTDGDIWQRQRRVIASNLNERISAIVWAESCTQALQMREAFIGTATTKTLDGLRRIAINVLGHAGYGTPQPWNLEEDLRPKRNTKLTYIQAISSIVNYLIVAAFVSTRILQLPFMPESLQILAQAIKELPTNTQEMLDNERKSAAAGSKTHANMMSMLVKLSDDAKNGQAEVKTTEKSQYLLEEEIQGNLFLFTIAGFDTTANSLGFAVVVLAAYPEWQNWISEEIDSVVADMKDVEYTKVFPRLNRCLALMFEILRIYPPLVHMARQSKGHQTLASNGNSVIHLPPKTSIYISNPALHSNKRTWGEDALVFRPTRWLTEDSSAGRSSLTTAQRGTFSPWSGGPRVCPGQKMSQVEFVAVMMTLFRNSRVEPVLSDGESLENARLRLIEITQDSQPRVTLQMNRPNDVKLKWIRR